MILFRAPADGAALPARESEGLDFREIGRDAFSRDALFREAGRSARFPQRLDQGHRCFGFATPAGETAAYLWLTTPDVGMAPFELGLAWRIATGAGYVWDCRTAPAFRNRGLFRRGLGRLRARCGEEGLDQVFIAARADNAASQRAITAAGFSMERPVSVLRLPGGVCLVREPGRIALRRRGGLLDLVAQAGRGGA